MMNTITDQKGFTLLEILLVFVLLTIVSALFYNAYFDSTRSWAFNKNRIELQRAQDVTNRWLSRYVRIADVESSSNNIVNTNNQNNLIFETKKGDTIKYFLDNGYLKISINSVERQICDCKFQDIEFNYNSSLNVLEFSATIIIDEDREPYEFNSVFYPRVQN